MNAPPLPPVLNSFPRRRPPLPPAYARIYAEEYRANRVGGNWLARAVQGLEGWMHRVIARDGGARPGPVLELGAGTLNHLPYEGARPYDVVEPFDALYDAGTAQGQIRQRFRAMDEVPAERCYQRILSVAVLEHLQDLPGVIARSALHLTADGICQHSIPSEGGLAWGLAWRLTTAVAYRLRTGLSYGVLMRYEHLNRADEILTVLRWFYAEVRVRRFPLPGLHPSLYTYIRASAPRLERCRAYLERCGSPPP